MDGKKKLVGQLGIMILVMLVLGGCSVPSLGQTPTDVPAADVLPANSVGPLPPDLVETAPLPGSELPVDGEITFYFNQPMEKSSVEAALGGTPALNGTFRWADDATLVFSPAQPWPQSTALNISLAATARSADGLVMEQPVELDYSTADYLRLTQALPEMETDRVDPEAAIVAAFNQPVVALGPDSADLSAGFTLDPAAEGHGEWLNTSTYIFYPAPALSGGQTYQVNVNPALESTDGSPLAETLSWSFTTLHPEAISYFPTQPNAMHIRLDEPVVVEFNQAMDRTSVEAAFRMVDGQNTTIPGRFEWSDNLKQMTFTPDALYRRGGHYTYTIPAGVLSLGGTALPVPVNGNFYAAMDPFVLGTTPVSDGSKDQYQPVTIQFNVPIGSENPLDYIQVVPEVSLRAEVLEDTLQLYGDFEAEQAYTITVGRGLTDIWGGQTSFDYVFSFIEAPLSASFLPGIFQGMGAVVVNAGEPLLSAQVVNVDRVVVQTGRVSLEDFLDQQLLGVYDNPFTPAEIKESTARLNINRNRSQVVGIPMNSGDALTPGLYWLTLEPQPMPQYSQKTISYAVVTNVQMVFKIGPTDTLVWAIDRRTNNAVVETRVRIVTSDGLVLADGRTDGAGLFRTPLTLPEENTDTTFYAVLGEPGSEFFSLAKSNWNQGINAWDFDYRSIFQPPHTEYYLYTDRPIYRPGQTVEYRVIARQAFDARYQLPAVDGATLVVDDARGQTLERRSISLDAYGAGNGSYTIPEGASPGYYQVYVEDSPYSGRITFQVAEYRKPELDLSINLAADEILAGSSLEGEVNADYFFDAPAAGVSVEWNVYAQDTRFSLPGYQVGPSDLFSSFYMNYLGGGLGEWQAGGNGTTGVDGRFTFTLPTEATNRTRTYTVETVIQDESGLPVATREQMTVHPDDVYFGLRSDSWLGRADTEMVFDVIAVDWNQQPAGVQDLTVSFGEVTWERTADAMYGFPNYEKRVTVLTEASFQTNEEGKIRLPFTPAAPGVYQLEVRSGNALSQMLFWVSGVGAPLWPQFDSSQIDLVTDKDSYAPGEVASVFIPNPFLGPALAMVTYERDTIMEARMIQIDESGFSMPVELTEDSAPNIYLTVTLLGPEDFGKLGYRYGVVNLPVDASDKLLNVEVTGDPQRAAPGEPVTFSIRVTDASGAPVEGAFSVAVVDKAVLALADPFEEDIVEAFYGERPLGVQTGISMSADAELYLNLPGGLGGGGGGDYASTSVRSEFEDTAYWNASIVTDQDGIATVEAVLPDNLTTWRVLVRGLTVDTLVGEAVSEVVSTKPLLVRPALPRFAVVGDHLELAAVVHNNTTAPLEVSLALKVSGVTLDAQAEALQTIAVPANGRVRVGWWGTVDETDVLEVTLVAEGGGYTDSVQTESGGLPVYGYLAPQAFTTAGVMDSGGERLELVSVPRSFEAVGGSLRLELASSLGGVALEGLEIMDAYESESAEYIVSRFLPNLEMYRAIQAFGLDEDALWERLQMELLDSVEQLESSQNFDGGWNWDNRGMGASNPITSAYVALGLTRAQQAGYTVNAYVMESAVRYLTDYLALNQPEADSPWRYDQAAFMHYVLAEAGSPMYDLAMSLSESPEQLSPWGQALLGLALADGPAESRAAALFSNLQTSAVRSASGAHWEMPTAHWQNMSSEVVNNAMVIYALAQQAPASPLVTDALRYLMSLRDAEGGWRSSYGTSWALLAITEVMRGTAELGGEFAFSASLNDNPFAVGEAGGVEQFDQVVAETSLESLLTDLPNALKIMRDPGTGRLYYRANLNIVQPVGQVLPVNRGVGVSRVYYAADADCAGQDCAPIQSAAVGDLVTVRVTINLPHAVHYLQVEDYIPAGTEVLDMQLKTTQLGEMQQDQIYDPTDPFATGWGWWYFGNPKVYDNRIAWMGEYLPAGTYELTYTLVVLQPGQFQVIPAQAYQIYFPEVQGVSAGDVFEAVP